MENKDPDYDYGDVINVGGIYYDGQSAGGKNCSWICVGVPYSVFYLWGEDFERRKNGGDCASAVDNGYRRMSQQ